MADEKQNPEIETAQSNEVLPAQDKPFEWTEFLNTLVVPKDTEIEDVLGNTYSVRSNLPAAVEIRLIRSIKQISEMFSIYAGDAGKVISEASTTAERFSALIDLIVDLCADNEMRAIVATAFAEAHPGVLTTAIERAYADATMVPYLPKNKLEADATHVFSLVDIVGAIVPFVVRAAMKGGKLVGRFLPSAT